MKYIITFAFCALISACVTSQQPDKMIDETHNENFKKIDSLNSSLEWKKLKCGLYKSKNNDIAFKDMGVLEDRYITQINLDGEDLKKILDTTTFRFIGGSFYKDKNHVYNHYAMAYGGNFQILVEADTKTFTMINDCYAKDKKYIYIERIGRMDSIDYNTFKSKRGIGCFSKDKNGYYEWNRKIDRSSLTDSIFIKRINELKNL